MNVLENYQNNDLDKYAQFLKANDIGVGAIEYAENQNGQRLVYDINTNTNYNSVAEATFGNQKQGMYEIAKFLGEELNKLQGKSRLRA